MILVVEKLCNRQEEKNNYNNPKLCQCYGIIPSLEYTENAITY